jgi:hypothetical protein
MTDNSFSSLTEDLRRRREIMNIKNTCTSENFSFLPLQSHVPLSQHSSTLIPKLPLDAISQIPPSSENISVKNMNLRQQNEEKAEIKPLIIRNVGEVRQRYRQRKLVEEKQVLKRHINSINRHNLNMKSISDKVNEISNEDNLNIETKSMCTNSEFEYVSMNKIERNDTWRHGEVVDGYYLMDNLLYSEVCVSCMNAFI